MARPRCPICRSRRWHRDRSSGLVVCEEGHVLQGYRQEDNEAEGPSTHATRLRKLRKNKQKNAARTADLDLFHGPRLRFLYFQCAQIILRKQIAAIIDVWKLPPELETVARDLWAMYISLTDLEAEPFKEREEEDIPNSPDKMAQRDSLQKIYDALSESEDEAFPPSRRKSRMRNPENDDEDDDDFVDEDMQEEEDEENDGDNLEATGAWPRRRQKKNKGTFNPARKLRLHCTLVICYLSCLTLRVPIFLKDILDLAQSYKLDYLEALNAIPEDMRRHLDLGAAEHDFVPSHVLPLIGQIPSASQPEDSFAPLVNTFAKMLHKAFGVKFPEINAAPILYKTVKHLGLPPFLYLVTRRVLIRLHSSMSLNLRSYGSRDFPDLTLAAALVFSIKLLWGLDGIPRIPQDANDMSSALPRLNEWLDFSEKLQKQYPLSMAVTAARSQDVASLEDDDADEFLDFFKETLMTDFTKDKRVLGTLAVPKDGIKRIEGFFPLSSTSAPSDTTPFDTRVAQREEAIRSFYTSVSMPMPGEISSSDPLFSGQQQRIYRAADHEGSLPRDYARVLHIVEHVTGIHSSVVGAAVSKIELKFAKEEAGTTQYLPTNHLPVQGRESQMFGRLRNRGGGTPIAKEILPEIRAAKAEKEPALRMPRFHA